MRVPRDRQSRTSPYWVRRHCFDNLTSTAK